MIQSQIPTALAYDDVLIVPKHSTLMSRSEAITKTRLTKKLNINIPLVSANMDTVTESKMAITLARLGGIGILHRFMTIEENVEEIRKVKRAQNFIISNPYTISQEVTIKEARYFVENHGVAGLLVVDDDNKLLGVMSRRDFWFNENPDVKVKDIMTPREKLIVGHDRITFQEAKDLLIKHKVEKLPLVDANNRVVGLITGEDIRNSIQYPLASLDANSRLLVGGSVGVHGDYLERAQKLVEAGADVLVIDIAHGDSEIMLKAIKEIRDICGDVQLIAGNIATAKAADELCRAGVDAVKVGVGPGSICVTRLVSGCGVPQFTAVMNVSRVAQQYGVPVIADGGVKKSGDIVKAIGAGADSIMIGGLLAGTEESPGVVMQRNDKKFKICRGSASFSVAMRRKNINQEKKNLGDVVPEGIESIVPFKGLAVDTIVQLVGGLKSGMSYTNSHTITDLQTNAEFVRITPSGQQESGPHDVVALT